MKKNSKLKLVSFASVVIMIVHLVLLQISMAKYSSFEGARWYNDSNKLILLVLYGLPILLISVLCVCFMLAKKPIVQIALSISKLLVVLMVGLLVFTFMLLFYHSPSAAEFRLLIATGSAVAIFSVFITGFEIAVAIDKEQTSNQFCTYTQKY